MDDYTIIANYSDEFKDSTVAAFETGWVTGSCNGEIAKEISFTGGQKPEPIPGDLDGDGDVDGDDRSILIGALRKCTGDTGYLSIADYDADGCITGNDYREWYNYYKNFNNP